MLRFFNHRRKVNKLVITWTLFACISLCGCTGGEFFSVSENGNTAENLPQDAEWGNQAADVGAVPLKITGIRENAAATEFSITDYESGYSSIEISDGRQYLIVPEGAEVPEDTMGMTVIKRPVDNIYLANSAAMCEFAELGAVDSVRFSGIEKDDWTIDEAVRAMESGDMIFCGNYGAPDYETLTVEGCELAIENTMVTHKPEVVEKLEGLGIPVLIDRASYEMDPIGRMEWIKVYGLILGKEDAAEAAFSEQKAIVDSLEEFGNTGYTVVACYVSANGQIVCTKGGSSFARMTEMAGGNYILAADENDDSVKSTVKYGMEEFMTLAGEADFLVYDSTIDHVDSLDDIIDRNAMFAVFKAFEDGNVWVMESSLYQNSNEVGTIVSDIHNMLTGEGETVHLRKLGNN
ncbi:MAG: ABC transporter substrate-binding protein [Lachnospiraceae bacterium]|nr:ABC transporter substrate-binding protein [Lachnospiraceae bacterium]